MAQMAFRRDDIPNPLLQLLRFGKPAFGLARPDRLSIAAHFKHAAGTGLQGQFANLVVNNS
jgi:hypothetical protein